MAVMSLRAFGLPVSIAVTCGLENTRGKCKNELYMFAWWPVMVVSDPKIMRKEMQFCSGGRLCS